MIDLTVLFCFVFSFQTIRLLRSGGRQDQLGSSKGRENDHLLQSWNVKVKNFVFDTKKK